MDHCYYTSVVLMYILELNTICIHFYCMENCAEHLLFSQDKENHTVSTLNKGRLFTMMVMCWESWRPERCNTL